MSDIITEHSLQTRPTNRFQSTQIDAQTTEALRQNGTVIVGLAELPERALLDEGRLAELLGVSRRTIRRMRKRFEIPPPVRIAGRSMWFSGRVLAYIEGEAIKLENESLRNSRRLK